MSTMRWEHFPHEADMGIRGIGDTRDQAFEQAALAMTAVITDPAKVGATETVEITRQAPDGEPMDLAKHQMAVEIKGATYTALRVAQEEDGEWVAQCVVDV
jgi:SHS2 domain-containing protein